ncbi:MAG TPA: alpha/beta fold hydrolase [Longimicrobiales bacterium]|nr:alpha/beta fold hydrolase [Longimicrobiales bacterium]
MRPGGGASGPRAEIPGAGILRAARGGRSARRAALAAGLLLAAALLAGPRARVSERWTEPRLGPDLDADLAAREAAVPDLRAGEAGSVLWAGSPGERTPLALAYLHGFSADRHEVEPLVSGLAAELGANAYFARLSGHGATPEALGRATAEDWLDDVAEAVAVGGRIGERVVLVGTSTGGTLALWAAGREEAAGRVAALVLISPNLGVADPAARLLLWPWGGLLARLAEGPERCFEPVSAQQARHWTTCYPTSALLPMMALVDLVRGAPPGSVRVPVLVFRSPDDRVVDAMSSARALERLVAGRLEVVEIADAGDPQAHVLAGDILSPGTTERVQAEIASFLRSLAPAPE